MAAPARIDELRHRYAAQPRRYLAPLANALRQAGALEEAVTMLRAQLAEYPDHLTGHVVLGYALFDTGALADAQTAFESARALDPGNRVVLRQLGEIASLAGDRDTARLWFERLRAAEPYADDVAAQLGGGATEPPDIDERVGNAAAIAPTQEVSPAAEAFAPEAFELLEFDTAPLDPVVGLDVAPATPPTELQADTHDDAHDAERTSIAALPYDAAAEPWTDATAALDHITAGPFATETMAGLLAAQGHTGQAIALYERLTAERPDDAALRARLQALRGESDDSVATAERADFGTAPVVVSVVGTSVSDAARGALLAGAFADLPSRRANTVPDEVAPEVIDAAEVAPTADTPVGAPALDETDPFADVSFDRFFAVPNATSADAVGTAAADAGGVPVDDADLARFDAWLRDVAA